MGTVGQGPRRDAFRAVYRIRPRTLTLDSAAELLLAEQTTGRHSVGGSGGTAASEDSLRKRDLSGGLSGARVESIDHESSTVAVSYPKESFASVPGLLAVLVGEVMELQEFESVRLLDLSLPDGAFGLAGPAFGAPGVRSALGVRRRPLLAAIIKPSTGMTPEEAAELAEEYVAGGADAVKDDEVAVASYEELARRAHLVGRAVTSAAQSRGRPAAYFLNVTGPLEELEARLELCKAQPSVWPMLCEHAVGFDALRIAASVAARPILCHRAGAAVHLRSERFGLSHKVAVSLARACGGDLVHCGSLRGKLFDTEDQVRESVQAATSSLHNNLGRPALALVGGGYGRESVELAVRELGVKELCFVVGASVAFSEDGPRRAVRAVLDALEELEAEEEEEPLEGGS